MKPVCASCPSRARSKRRHARYWFGGKNNTCFFSCLSYSCASFTPFFSSPIVAVPLGSGTLVCGSSVHLRIFPHERHLAGGKDFAGKDRLESEFQLCNLSVYDLKQCKKSSPGPQFPHFFLNGNNDVRIMRNSRKRVKKCRVAVP